MEYREVFMNVIECTMKLHSRAKFQGKITGQDRIEAPTDFRLLCRSTTEESKRIFIDFVAMGVCLKRHMGSAVESWSKILSTNNYLPHIQGREDTQKSQRTCIRQD